MAPTSTTQHPRLSGPDADAVDALFEAGGDPEAVPPFLRDRARRANDLLGLLNPVDEQIEVTVSSPSFSSQTGGREADFGREALCAEDAEALDALIAAGWEPAAVAPRTRRRAKRVAKMLGLLDNGAEIIAEQSDPLVDATLARVQRAEQTTQLEWSAEAAADLAPAKRGGRYSLADIVSAAAMVLIAVSIAWPVVSGLRQSAMRTQSEANLSNAGLGFAMYAVDHKGRLPQASASLAGSVPGAIWWDVGDARHSHSANLFVLARRGYTSLEDLASPGNPHAPIHMNVNQHFDWRSPEEVSYSYQLFSDRQPRWDGSRRTIVLADRSPIVERARRGEDFDPMAGSHNHHGLGQHVLFNDRSVEWLSEPVTDQGDNIWLPASFSETSRRTLDGTERPVGPNDVFVGP